MKAGALATDPDPRTDASSHRARRQLDRDALAGEVCCGCEILKEKVWRTRTMVSA